MGTWENASVRMCQSVYDILMTLRRAGVNISPSPDHIAQQTLDMGEQMLSDASMWSGLPDELPRRVGSTPKAQLRADLKDLLDACR